MKIECPACAARGTIDESKLPAAGRQLTCPRCRHRFEVRSPRTGVEIIQQRERMVCPKCSCEQPLAEMCADCGIVVKNYLQTLVRQQEKERLEFVKLRTATREVDSWYSELFDRRLSSLVVRVLSLLVLLGVFMTCSMNSARRNRFYAENTAEMRRVAEGQGSSSSPERNDSDFRDKFATVVDLMIGSTDACLSQNYNYKTSWYQNSQPYYLTTALADNLSIINRRRNEANAAFSRLPAPSKKYFGCYLKAKGLASLQGQVCGLANDYATHHADFSERLSNFGFEFSKIRDELSACKESCK